MQKLFQNKKVGMCVRYAVLAFFVFVVSVPVMAFESKAKYAILVDMETGAVLYEKNADVQIGPASMTKLMTAYLIFDALKRDVITLETAFPVSERAWKKGGSKMFVKAGDDIAVHDLLQGIIVQSGNDACIVVAEGLAGSEEAFAEDMNYMAKEIGLTASHFKNSTGWPDSEHLMTVRDLATLAGRIIRDFPEYYGYYSQLEYTYAGITQQNRNTLLKRNIGVDGLKTGHTEGSGYGITVSAEQDGRRLVAVVNGLDSEAGRIQEAERLIRHGFRDFENIVLYNPGDVVHQAELWLGKKDAVPLITKESVIINKPQRISLESKINLQVTYNAPWPAPVMKGVHMANLVVKHDGEVIQQVPLYAGQDVAQQSFLHRLWSILKSKLLGDDAP